jgi:hypothetical protein
MAGPKVLIIDPLPPIPDDSEDWEDEGEEVDTLDDNDPDQHFRLTLPPRGSDDEDVLAALHWAATEFPGEPVKTIKLVKFASVPWSVFMATLDKLAAEGQITRDGDRISWPELPQEGKQSQ